MRVMLVDDEAAILRTMKRYLVRHGFVVSCVEDATTALAMLEAEPHDIIISDFKMPGNTNGVQLLQAVAARYPQMKRILHSGCAQVSGEDLVVPRGIEFLRKPCTLVELVKVCR